MEPAKDGCKKLSACSKFYGTLKLCQDMFLAACGIKRRAGKRVQHISKMATSSASSSGKDHPGSSSFLVRNKLFFLTIPAYSCLLFL